MLKHAHEHNINYGGKLVLPPSALDVLVKKNVAHPMVFSLHFPKTGKTSHAGVLEFIAEEGRVYLPQWLMSTLGVVQGDIIQLESCRLVKGTFVKLQPLSLDFLDITDPKAV